MSIRWVDKLTILDNGDIIDFNGQIVGHIKRLNVDLTDFDNNESEDK